MAVREKKWNIVQFLDGHLFDVIRIEEGYK